ncbi:hypothetical protein [Hymenobacter terrestris]|uniref:Uncharacterized protein n=1 Tax=Hymenobacter terrestris TaxID=2748310 RepID=A0ABX2Q2F9_9BACT|nr:hypothetical protein [Hymenobacter terrestris]NVO85148.1 hypothetical protein [Hymenobacter terrestris]
MNFAVYRRAVGLFYQRLLPLTSLGSGLILGSAVLFGNWPLPLNASVVLMKLSTFPLIWYVGQRTWPDQHWFYRNLHLAQWQLWAPLVVFDTVGFAMLVGLIHQLAA